MSIFLSVEEEEENINQMKSSKNNVNLLDGIEWNLRTTRTVMINK